MIPIRAQVSVEYLMIIAFAFAILIPGIYFFYVSSQSSSSGMVSSQYAKLGQEMISNALKAAAQGKDSWLTLDALIPDSIEAINVSKKELVFTYQGSGGETVAVFFSDVVLSNKEGSQNDGSIFAGDAHSGKAQFRFVAKGDYVAIVEKYE